MKRVCFVCYGNICRSPMAEFLLRRELERRGIAEKYDILSAATSCEEIGNPVYPPVRDLLVREGINPSGKRALKLTEQMADGCDYIVGMEDSNLVAINRIVGAKNSSKVYKLLSFTGSDGNIADPWYTRDFDKCFDEISEGVKAFADYLEKL